MTTLKKILCICVMAAVLVMTFPVSSLAVDPVSAATMANALAQAITAYGASQGVSMTFDVTNTDGIGEGVHNLWNQYKDDANDFNIPTFDSLAVNMWSNLYSKVNDKLAINISETVKPYIDGFWNWILSGPAEMVKVDNQYYEWVVNPQTGSVLPINVLNDVTTSFNGVTVYSLPRQFNGQISIIQSGVSGDPYSLCVRNSSTQVQIFSVSDSPFACSYDIVNGSNVGGGNGTLSSGGWYFTQLGLSADESQVIADVTYNGSPVLIDNILGQRTSNSIDSNVKDINVCPYVGTANPQKVYIPDNNDVNYQPLPSIIPLNIPWSNTNFGDGSDTLTNSQSTSATNTITNTITNSVEKTIILDNTANPNIPANEVYIPLLPVTLPNFNFSLSGIWHYVVSWVQSLGAWLSLTFQTWAVLPSAISIPVYATAVIVIVLGIYKRFFM